VLIDSGSQVNYINGKLAVKLGLKVNDRPTEYCRHVRTVDGTLHETSSYVVMQTFYPESSLTFNFFAHMLNLDGKHSFILGRPWLNQYNPMNSLNIKGKVQVGKRKELIQLASPQEFKQLVRKSSSMLGVILVRPQKNAITSTPHAILEEFKDFFPEQLPDELPPERPIQKNRFFTCHEAPSPLF
jgi:hypothetical protein